MLFSYNLKTSRVIGKAGGGERRLLKSRGNGARLACLVKGGKYRTLIRDIKRTLLSTVEQTASNLVFIASNGRGRNGGVMLAEVEEWWRKRAHEVSGWPRLVSPFSFISGPTEAFHSGLSGFSKFSEGRPPSLFSPPNFVVQRVDRQRAVRRRTRGGNRN